MLTTIILVATAIVNFASATPIATNLNTRQIIPSFPPQYPFSCNALALPTNEISDCFKDLTASAAGKDKIKVETHSDGIYSHLCQRPHVYVTGLAWGESMAEAEAIAVANAVQWILWTCGSGGGSMSANGAQGEKSYIVHVSDHWAFGSS